MRSGSTGNPRTLSAAPAATSTTGAEIVGALDRLLPFLGTAFVSTSGEVMAPSTIGPPTPNAARRTESESLNRRLMPSTTLWPP